MNRPDKNSEKDPGAPPRFVAELKRACAKPDLFIPRGVDDAILLAAQRRLRKPQPKLWPRPRLFSWLATATAIAIVALFVSLRPGTDRGRWAAHDVNRDGTVDILDALIVAKALKAEGMAEFQVDRSQLSDATVQAIVARAVSLERSGS